MGKDTEQLFDNRYQLLDLLGEGGMGRVYLAQDTKLNRLVALKFIKDAIQAEKSQSVSSSSASLSLAPQQALMKREVDALKQLVHAHIVALYDARLDINTPYLVTQYFRGGTLATQLVTGRVLSLSKQKRILEQLCDALDYLHCNGRYTHRSYDLGLASETNSVLHLDLKPANILFHESGEDVAITDFGLSSIGMTIAKGHSYEYSAPEVRNGQDVDHRADIYSLGVIAWQLLTGFLPSHEQSTSRLAPQMLSVLQRAISVSPEGRYTSAGEMWQALLEAYEAPAPPLLGYAEPYKGLSQFEYDDDRIFFGRTELVSDIITQLPNTHFLAILGASGSGKSSVMRAGVIPLLQKGLNYRSSVSLPEGSNYWRYCVITPARMPLKNLLNSLVPDNGFAEEQLLAHQLDISSIIANTQLSLQQQDQIQLLLFIDQFEELFALNNDKLEVQEKFIEILLAATNSDFIRVIIAMRFDFMQQVAVFPKLEQAIRPQENHIIVTQLERGELKEVIELPAEKGDWQLQSGLVEQILEDVGQEAGALPLLSHALLETWKRRRWRTMTLDAYREIGGVQQAIARTAETAFSEFPEEQQQLARTVLLRLVKLGEGTPDTRQQVAISELAQLSFTKPEMDHVLKVLTDKRLVVIDKKLDEELDGNDYLKLSHEALIRYWPRLRNDIDENREHLRRLGRLRQQAIEWVEAERDPGRLLRGKLLVDAQAMVEDTAIQHELTSVEHEFVNASDTAEKATAAKEKSLLQERAAAMEEKAAAVQSQATTLRRALMVGSLLLLVAVVAAFIAVNRQNAALRETDARATSEAIAVAREEDANQARATAVFNESLAVAREVEANEARATAVFNENLAAENEAEAIEERDRANEEALRFLAQSLAAQSASVQDQNPQLSLLLAVEAAKVHTTIGEPVTEAALQSLRSSLATVGGIGLPGHSNYITDIAFSPDGSWLATMDNLAGETMLWDLTQENPADTPVVLHGHKDAVSAMAFSPDSQWLATGGGGNLNASTSILESIFDYRLSLRFGEVDGYDTAIRLWNLGDGSVFTLPETPFHDDDGFISYISFANDGSRLVSIDVDGSVLLWDLSNLDTPPPPQHLANLAGGLVTAVTSPDSRWLILKNLEGMLYRWDLMADMQNLSPETLQTAGGLFRPVAISPNGLLLATGGNDGEIQLLDFSGEDFASAVIEEYSLENEISQLAFSPDGNWFAAGTRSGDLAVWAVETDMFLKEPYLLDTRAEAIFHLEFHPDGKWLVVNYDGVERSNAWGTFELWSIGEDGPGETPESINAHELKIPAVTFSADGNWLASSSFDGTARLWRFGAFSKSGHADTLTNSHYRLEPQEVIFVAEFDPESKWLITGDNNGELRLWPIEKLENTQVGYSDLPYTNIEGHDSRVVKSAVSSDGLFATGSIDGMIRLTKVDEVGSTDSIMYAAHDDEINSLLFSQDGSLLISSGYDDTVRVWDVSQELTTNEVVTLQLETTILTVALDPTGRWLAGGGSSGKTYLWDLQAEDPGASVKIYDGHGLEITMVDISPDGHWLATGSADTTVRLWDLRADNLGDSVQVLQGHTDFVTTLAFSNDGQWLATGSFDNTGHLWHFIKGELDEESYVLGGHETFVFNLAFSSDNNFLYTSDFSGLIQAWNLTLDNPSQSATQLSANNRPIATLAVSPDNRWLVSGGQDGETVPGGLAFITSLGVPRVWPLETDTLVKMACETAGRNLTFAEYATYFPNEPYSITCNEFGVHPTVIETAQEAAINGDRSKALAIFTLAQSIDEQLNYDPNIETDRWIAQGIIQQARQAARNLQLEEATQLFSSALQLDPSLAFTPDTEAKRFAAPEYAWKAFSAAANDEIEEAINLMRLALSYNPTLDRLPEGAHSSSAAQSFTPRERLASGYHLLCTEGIYNGLFDDVAFYCEESIRLDPERAYLYDGRAMARALSGDFVGAIADIDLYIAWLETVEKDSNAATIMIWQQLRDEVAEGRNPFNTDFFELINSPGATSEETPSTWVQVSLDTIKDISIPISAGDTVEEVITYDDFKEFSDELVMSDTFADFYSIAVQAGNTVIFSIEAEKIGSQLDSYMWLLNDELIPILNEDDTFGTDSSITYTFDESGTYYVYVRDFYEGKYGEPVNFYYTLITELLSSPVPEVSSANIDQYITPLVIGSTISGAITKEDYKGLLVNGAEEIQYRYGDFYQLQLEADDIISVQILGNESLLNPVIFIYDDEFIFLETAAAEEGSSEAVLSFQVPETGVYYLFIRDKNEHVFGLESDYFYQVFVEQ